MADTKIEAPKRPTGAVKKLNMPSRVTAFALGVAGLGTGGVAVFITHLEAGPIGLLAVGLIFMIIALAGTLPTRLKVGDNEAAWEVEREAVETFVERVAEDIPVANQRRFLGALGDLAQGAPEVAARGISAVAWRQLVYQEIRSILDELQTPRVSATTQPINLSIEATVDMQRIDAALEGPAGLFVPVEITAGGNRYSDVGIDLIAMRFARHPRTSRDAARVLFISREPLTEEASEQLKLYPKICHVVFRGPEDRNALKNALRKVTIG